MILGIIKTILFCAALTACYKPMFIVGEQEKYDIKISENISKEHKQFILKGLKNWQYKTNNIFYPQVVDDCDKYDNCLQVFEVNSDHPIIKHYQSKNKNKIVGLYFEVEGKHFIFMIMDRIETDDEYKNIFQHELGHFLGLHHLFNKESSMFYSTEFKEKEISRDDIVVFCASRKKCEIVK
jgi:predicted Zn-dependent protease